MRFKLLSREQILKLASRQEGFFVHLYKWSHDRDRKLCNRMRKEGLLTREKVFKGFIFRTNNQTKGQQMQEIKITIGVCPNTIAALVALAKGQPVAQLDSVTEEKPKRGRKAKAQEIVDEDPLGVDEETDVEDLSDDEEVEETEDLETEEVEDEDAKVDAKQLAQLKKALNTYSGKHGKDKAVKILHKFAKVSQDVKADDFGKIMKALKV